MTDIVYSSQISLDPHKHRDGLIYVNAPFRRHDSFVKDVVTAPRLSSHLMQGVS